MIDAGKNLIGQIAKEPNNEQLMGYFTDWLYEYEPCLLPLFEKSRVVEHYPIVYNATEPSNILSVYSPFKYYRMYTHNNNVISYLSVTIQKIESELNIRTYCCLSSKIAAVNRIDKGQFFDLCRYFKKYIVRRIV